MKTTKTIITLAAVLLFGFTSLAAKTAFDTPLNTAKQAFDQRDFSVLKPLLEDGYMVKGIPAGYENIALEQFFAQFGSIQQYEILKRAEEGANTRLYVAFTLADGAVTNFDFLLTADGKFREFNVLNQAQIIQGDFGTALNTVEQAFNAKDFTILEPVLEDGYTVKGVPAGYEAMALEQFFAQVGAVQGYEIKKSAQEGTNVRLYTAFTFADGTVTSFDFLVTEAGKFQELNVLNQAEIIQE